MPGFKPLNMSKVSGLSGRIGKRYNGTSNTFSYTEGYPSVPDVVEANVAAQWTFSELTGSIVDKVSSLTLTATGSPVYNVPSSGLWRLLSPGINYPEGADHRNSSVGTALNLGTSEFTIEVWYRIDSSVANTALYLFDFRTGSNTRGYALYLDTTNNTINLALKATDDTAVTATFTPTADLDDNNWHKIRVTKANASNRLGGFLDGASLGTVSITSLSGKSINTTQAVIGNIHTAQVDRNTNAFHGTISTIRVSLNRSNNSGGPNGG